LGFVNRTFAISEPTSWSLLEIRCNRRLRCIALFFNNLELVMPSFSREDWLRDVALRQCRAFSEPYVTPMEFFASQGQPSFDASELRPGFARRVRLFVARVLAGRVKRL